MAADHTLHFHSPEATKPNLPPPSAGMLTLGLLAMVAGQVLVLADTDGAVAAIVSLVGLVTLVLGVSRLASNVDGLARRAAIRDFEAARAQGEGHATRHG